MTPWVPIVAALLATVGAGLLVGRLTGSSTVGISTGLLVMALILVVFAQIATVAYVPAGLLMLMAIVGFGAAWLARAGGSRT